MFRFIFSKTFLLQLLLAAVVVGLALFATYLYLESYTHAGEAIEVPEMNGYDIVEAEAVLKELKLSAEVVDSLFIQGKRGGEIVDQEPRGTSLVKSGRKIYLTITRYQTPSTKLPNVINQGLPLAQAKLTSYGFKVGKLIPRTDPCTDCAIGFEIQGKKVEVGQNLPKGTTIDIIFGENSRGMMASVPLLYGLSLDEAKLLLNNHNLNLGAKSIEAESKGDSLAAKVYWQSQPEKSQVTMGTAINVHLSPDVTKIPSVNLDSLKATFR